MNTKSVVPLVHNVGLQGGNKVLEYVGPVTRSCLRSCNMLLMEIHNQAQVSLYIIVCQLRMLRR